MFQPGLPQDLQEGVAEDEWVSPREGHLEVKMLSTCQADQSDNRKGACVTTRLLSGPHDWLDYQNMCYF